ncbi:hypothetical protein ACOSP7_002601 [Xanthoceras sorbifolium]
MANKCNLLNQHLLVYSSFRVFFYVLYPTQAQNVLYSYCDIRNNYTYGSFISFQCIPDRLLHHRIGQNPNTVYGLVLCRDIDAEAGNKSMESLLIELDILKVAMRNFSNENKVGEGELFDGKEIAVKRLSKSSGQGLEKLKTEVMLVAKLLHRNLAWQHWTNGTAMELLDPMLGNQLPKHEVLKCIHIGLLCVQEAAADRPIMSQIVMIFVSRGSSDLDTGMEDCRTSESQLSKSSPESLR